MAGTSDNLPRGLSASQDARVKRVVQAYEQTQPDAGKHPSSTSTPIGTIFVTLTGEDASNPGRYKWEKVDDTNGTWDYSSPAITSGSDYTARELNDITGIVNNVQVELRFYGYDTSTPPKPIYIFKLPQTGKARITAVSGSFPVFSYTVQMVVGYDSTKTDMTMWVTNGHNLTALNRCEWTSGSYPYTHGCGVTVTASDGTVNSGSCKIVHVGIGSTVDISIDYDHDGTKHFSFYVPNSAQ